LPMVVSYLLVSRYYRLQAKTASAVIDTATGYLGWRGSRSS
jgi:hypothetical protein